MYKLKNTSKWQKTYLGPNTSNFFLSISVFLRILAIHMTAGEGRDTSSFLSTTFTHFHPLSNIQTCIYIYLQTLHEIWLPSIFNPIACLSDRYPTRFTTFGNLHLIYYLLNVNFSCIGCFNNKCYCSTRFFLWTTLL